MSKTIDNTEHPCHKCLVRACCRNWCSDFFRWIFKYQKIHGVITDDVILDIVKRSRNESWSIK